MKLASLNSGRDGQLVVVSRDLTRAVSAAAIAPTLQAAMDDWSVCEPKLQALFDALQAGRKAELSSQYCGADRATAPVNADPVSVLESLASATYREGRQCQTHKRDGSWRWHCRQVDNLAVQSQVGVVDNIRVRNW